MTTAALRRLVPLIGFVAFAPGCGKVEPELTTLRLEDVPADLMKIAREKLPGVTFDTAWKKTSGTYEIRGKARNGKIREVDIAPDGTIVEVE